MKIVNVVGARPNFVKIAPLLRAMRAHSELEPVLIHTGQHYDPTMCDRFFSDLKLPAPDFNLGVGSGSHAAQTADVMRRLEPVLESLHPGLLLVVGDVNSTLGAALTATKLGIPIAHVEAGLRSFDRRMPEEINRVLTDAISDLLFVTEESGRDNLLREGIPPDRIHFVGNVMIDALELFRPLWRKSSIVDRLGLARGQSYGVLTLHRPSNVESPHVWSDLLDVIRTIARRLPIVFPVHPRIREHVLRNGGAFRLNGSTEPFPRDGIVCVDPLGYLDCVALLNRARLVMTDSGGIQEETTVLGVPCLTLRENTERPVTISHGTNRLVGIARQRILTEALRALASPRDAVRASPPLWDGRAAERIVRIVLEHVIRGEAMEQRTERAS